MSKIISLKVTFVILILLILLIFCGTVLTEISPHDDAIRSLSKQLPLTWFLNEGQNDLTVSAWLVSLCGVAICFFVHMLLCIGIRFYRRIISRSLSLRQWCFILLHIMFLVVMLCHGLNMVLGYKISDIKMVPGDRYRFDKNLVLTLSDVRFIDSPTILKTPYPQRRRLMTRESMHRRENCARIILHRNGEILSSGPISVLSPLRFGSLQITLSDFFISTNRDESMGVKLIITRNPIVNLFFATYAMLIFTFGAYVVLNWHYEKVTSYRPIRNTTPIERKLSCD